MNEPKLIEIIKPGKIIFVGDTHGDFEASQKVIKDYLKTGNKIVFLGDYVDRGPYSKENLNFLLETKNKNPDQVYLLQGNHEGHHILKFSPAEFWESLDYNQPSASSQPSTTSLYKKYCSIVEKFPLAVSAGKIIALHGALPDIKNLNEINEIKSGSEEWLRICWGDFIDKPQEYLGIDTFSGRPRFGQNYFLKLMQKFNKKVLIRSHQPDCPQLMFDDRCLTIFTSSAYNRERTIAIADLRNPIKTARDLKVLRI